MHKQSCDRISHISPSAQTSEATTQSQENLTLSQWDGRVREHQTQETNKDSNIQLPHSGEKDLEYCSKLNPSSVLWNNLKALSDEDLELFLPASIWQDTLLRLKQSRRESLDYRTRDSEYLFFPTLTSNECSTSRPAGQTKCEKWFKDNGLIPSGSQLSAQAIALVMGFPSNWFEVLSQKNSNQKIILSQVKPQEESEQDISQEELVLRSKQPSPSEEFSTCPSCKAQTIKLTEGCGICGWLGCDFLLGDKSAKTEIPVTDIPCLIKQPHKKPFEGLIVGDRGDKFDVKVDDRIVALPKLYVFPNFPSKKKCQTDDEISPSKTRRKKGTGSGSIYWRTIKKNGKDYQQTYYHYEIWDKGNRLVKSCEYIPKRMRSQIEKMNDEKVPVEEILKVLRNRSKRKK